MYSWFELTYCWFLNMQTSIASLDWWTHPNEWKTKRNTGLTSPKALRLNTHYYYYYHSNWFYFRRISLWIPPSIGDCCDGCCLRNTTDDCLKISFFKKWQKIQWMYIRKLSTESKPCYWINVLNVKNLNLSENKEAYTDFSRRTAT